MPNQYVTRAPEDRIWDYIDLGPHPHGCWLWTGSVSSNGYGSYMVRRVTHNAHRAMFMFAVRDDIEGLVVCHSCDNRLCVNPLHLFLGSQKDNVEDRDKKGRWQPWIGEKHPRALVTEVQVREIRALSESGEESYRTLSERYGVSRPTIAAIVTRKNWAHVV